MNAPTNGESNNSAENDTPPGMDSSDAVTAFLEAYREDLLHDRIRPVEEYVEQCDPSHAGAIQREYALLEDDSGTSAESASSVRNIGPYRIVGELGSGGQATVYRAMDDRLGRAVALKVLDLTLLPRSPTERQRFRREAELTARLDHPAIAAVLDVGEDASRHTAYIAIRLVAGETLAHHIARCAKSAMSAVELPSSTGSTSGWDSIFSVLELIEKVARALHVAHEHNLIHRDIKPGNIMVTPGGEPVILDFGLAREASGDDLALTRSSDMLGTPYYMSPEQLAENRPPLDRRTDVYSLGVTLWECLTLHRPFEGTSREALYRKIRHDSPSSPTQHNKAIPKELRIVLETAMEKDVDRRYPTALALADDLRRLRRFEPISARPSPMTLRARRWVQRNRTVATFLALITVALGVTLFLLLGLQRKNVELQKTNDAATLLKVTDLLEDTRGRPNATRRGLLDSIQPERRGFAWKWLEARSAPLVPEWKIESKANQGPLRSVSFSKDGKSLLAIRLDRNTPDARTEVSNGALCVVPIAAGAQESVLGPAFTARYVPDSNLIVAGDADGQRIQVYDATSHELRCEAAHPRRISALCCSRDGRIAAAGGPDGLIKVWSIHSPSNRVELVPVKGAKASTPIRFGRRVRAIEFSPDGQQLLIAGDHDKASILDPGTGEEKASFHFFVKSEQEHLRRRLGPERILAAHFSPDQELVVLAGQLGRVALFDAGNGRFVRELHAHRAAWTSDHRATEALFDPTGRFVVSCGSDKVLQVHEVKSGQRLDFFHPDAFLLTLAIDDIGSRIAISSKQRVVAGSDSSVSVWALGDLSISVDLAGDDRENISQVITTADQKWAFALGARSVRKYELATGRQVFAIRDRQRFPACIALRPGTEDELAIGYTLGQCEIVDARSGRVLHQWKADHEDVWPVDDRPATGFLSLCYSPDGSKLLGGLGSSRIGRDSRRPVPIFVFDSDDFTFERPPLVGHHGAVTSLVFSRDGRRLASANRQAEDLIIWDVASKDALEWKELPYEGTSIGNQIAGDGDHRLYSWSRRTGFTIHDFESGEIEEHLPVSAGHLWGIEFHPNGVEMLVATTTGAAIWDTPPENRLLSLAVGVPSTRAWSGAAHFVGDDGILVCGAAGLLSYHEVQPNPSRFAHRQVEWSAGQQVNRLLAEGLSVSDARRAVTDDLSWHTKLDMSAEMRAACLRILAGTNEDPYDVVATVFPTVIDPRHDRKTYAQALRILEAAWRGPGPVPAHLWGLPILIGVAHYRLGNDPMAERALKDACEMDKLRQWDQDPKLIADFQSFPWFFRAMAAHRSGDLAAMRRSLERAWAAGLGGRFDTMAAREAYTRMKISRGARPDTGSASPAAGPPDADRTRISAEAWSPVPSGAVPHILELRYRRALPLKEVRVFVVNQPGAIFRVEFVDETGSRTRPCLVKHDASSPGTFVVKAPEGIDFPVKTVRLHLDGTARTGIDTVQLWAIDGRYEWPIEAVSKNP